MGNKIIIVVIAVLFSAMSLVYFSPAQAMRRAVNHALDNVKNAVETKDRTKISAMLQSFIRDDAKIHLEVAFVSFAQQGKVSTQEFPDKQSFITFVDNVLYPMTDFSYLPRLDSIDESPDHKSANITFTSAEWGDGSSLYGGNSVQVRYSSSSECKAVAVFSDKRSDPPSLSSLSCSMQVRTVPKPGEAEKFRDMNSLNDLLK